MDGGAVHGQHPYVMAQGLGNFSDEAYEEARRNMTGRPIRRDTNVGTFTFTLSLTMAYPTTLHQASFSISLLSVATSLALTFVGSLLARIQYIPVH